MNEWMNEWMNNFIAVSKILASCKQYAIIVDTYSTAQKKPSRFANSYRMDTERVWQDEQNGYKTGTEWNGYTWKWNGNWMRSVEHSLWSFFFSVLYYILIIILKFQSLKTYGT